MRHKRKIVYALGFLFSIPFALVSYVNSSFLESHIGKDYVGLAYVAASLATILALAKMPKILSRFGNFTTALVSSFLIFISFLSLAFAENVFVIIPAFIIYFASGGMMIASLDIFVEGSSESGSVGKTRGLYLLSINLAWVFAQVVSSSIIESDSFTRIYLTASASIMTMMFVLIVRFRDFKDPKYKKVSIRKTIKFFLGRKNARCIYVSNFILQFFYAWMVIYLPIYLRENVGFEWPSISAIFAIMLLPFVILDYPLGKLSDKIGEREMLLFGFAIVSLFTLLLPLSKDPSIFIWAGLLFMTRIGAATIEVMNDAYFFKIIKEENADEVDFFRNASPFAYIIASIIALPILFFAPGLDYIFYILSAILLIGFFTVLKIRDRK